MKTPRVRRPKPELKWVCDTCGEAYTNMPFACCGTAEFHQATQQLALSVRQPWAWLIVNRYKPIENRTWPTKHTGRIYIHASKTMTKGDYEACRIFVAGISNVSLPDFDHLKSFCGGIVGEADLVGCVTESSSDWFVGPYGHVLVSAKPLRFYPCKGTTGYFRLELLCECAGCTRRASHRDKFGMLFCTKCKEGDPGKYTCGFAALNLLATKQEGPCQPS